MSNLSYLQKQKSDLIAKKEELLNKICEKRKRNQNTINEEKELIEIENKISEVESLITDELRH